MKVQSTIINELGNRILFTVELDDRGVTISSTGPTSEVEHTWTKAEAIQIKDLISSLNLE